MWYQNYRDIYQHYLLIRFLFFPKISLGKSGLSQVYTRNSEIAYMISNCWENIMKLPPCTCISTRILNDRCNYQGCSSVGQCMVGWPTWHLALNFQFWTQTRSTPVSKVLKAMKNQYENGQLSSKFQFS